MKKENLFTKDEIEVVEAYLFKKICRLEEAGLTDSRCYPLLFSFRRKLLKLNENIKTNEKARKKL